MANTIKIIIDAIDNASGTINNVNSSLEGLDNEQKKGVKSSLALGAGLAVAGAAIGAVVDYTKKAIAETVTYNQDIDSLSRSIGVSREETSRLVQVGESLAISQKDLASAFQYAKKNGIDVSIEGVKNLSKEYINLGTASLKAEFLTNNFGSSNADLGRLLELGTTEIEKRTAAIKESLVVTDESYRATQSYIESQERLKDVQDSLQTSVGLVAMEGWTQVLLGLNVLINGYTDSVEEATTATRGFTYVNNYFGTGLKAFEEWLKKSNKEIDNAGETWLSMITKLNSANKTYTNTLEDLTTARSDEKAKLDEATAGYWSYVDAGRAVWNELQSVNDQLKVYRPALDTTGESLKSLLERQQELRAELEDYDQVWGQDKKAIEKSGEALDILNEKIQENVRQHQIATNEILLDNLKQALSVDGLSLEESQILLRMGEAWGIYEKGVAESLGLAIEHAGEWGEEVQRLPTAKSFTYNLYGNITQSFIDAMTAAGNWYGASGEQDTEGEHAWGGWESANTPYLVGERGPEIFVPGTGGKIIPNNQLGGGGGSEIDYDRLTRAMVEALERSSLVR